ncbi:hypothetical protein LJC27_07530 [Christensenellaceae bacterium OttesenSCG-928-M15]|nr:hypothetical protein [Christensenellaceae bacterium OttesenSCG-928-M15]
MKTTFHLAKYTKPDFSWPEFARSPNVKTAFVETQGVAPSYYHATSIYPEYFKMGGEWMLAEEMRMDCCVVVRPSRLEVMELRKLIVGDEVVLGRTENCEEGIYLHTNGFEVEESPELNFAFRTGRSRETAFSMDYDNLYALLEYEREHGNTAWVMGPACAFDADARSSMRTLIQNGFVDALLAGNALATHDLEAAYFKTALGQNIYTQQLIKDGHYNHLDVLNLVRRAGSIAAFLKEQGIEDGIMQSLVEKNVPYVLTSSIRDDGPLPEVIANAYEGQDRMREILNKATTVICLATQLHTIASSNMLPTYRVVDGVVRPVFLYSVDISEFVVNKVRDRGNLRAISMVTNVQDFVVHVARGVTKADEPLL